MHKIGIFFLSLGLFSTSSAQELYSETTPVKHALGIAGSGDGGFGFSYRYLPKKVGVQVNFLASFLNEQYVQSTGVSLQYRFRSAERIDAYGYFASNFLFNSYKYSPKFNGMFTSGLGAGINIRFVEYMTLQLQAGYAIYDITNTQEIFSGRQSGFSPGIGLHYNF